MAVAAHNTYKPIDLSRSHVDAWRSDLLADAVFAETQAADGPFYPDRGITAETLLAYAAECRAKAADPKRSLYQTLKGMS